MDARIHELPKDSGQEVRNCLDNVGRVLKQAGMDYSNVVSVQIFLVDMSQFQEVNSIYKAYFKTPFPSRTTVQVSKLSLGARIEIAAVAHKQVAEKSRESVPIFEELVNLVCPKDVEAQIRLLRCS